MARLKGRIAFDALPARVPAPHLAGPVTDRRWHPNLLVNALTELPVTLTPES